MKVTLKYLGPVSLIAKKREEELEILPSANVHEMLRQLCSLYGKGFEDEVLQDGGEKLRSGTAITINGTVIGRLDGLGTKLKAGDTVALLPLFLGGG